MKPGPFDAPVFVQNRTKFRHFLPKRGRIWHKIDVLRDRFCENVPGPAARAMPTSAEPKLAGRPKTSPEQPHTYAGGRSPDLREDGWLVTDMVELRKLTMRINRHFPLWISDHGGKPVLQTSGLSEAVSVFGRFWGYQISPNFTNSYQKRAANALEGADKG